jgi:hypothetical protein
MVSRRFSVTECSLVHFDSRAATQYWGARGIHSHGWREPHLMIADFDLPFVAVESMVTTRT